MAKKALIIKESAYFYEGQIVEGNTAENGFSIDEHFVSDGNYILLEKLNAQDEEQVRHIVRDLLKRFLWRQYTRSAFLLK